MRIFVGTDETQIVAHRVLEYSIRKSATVPVEFVPMLNVPHPMPRDPANRPRTTFSFCRFVIPERCDYHGRALYLDADTLVFGDVAELADLPFGGHKILTSAPQPTAAWNGRGGAYLGSRSVAVMLLDCGRLSWKVDDVVAGLDEGRYSYEELMSELSLEGPDEIADSIPPEWNHLERYEPGRTKLLHYTVVPTQPWKNDDNPLGQIWMSWYGDAVEAGAVPPEEVEALVAAGRAKSSLLAALRLAPSRRTGAPNASLELATAHQQLQQRITTLEDTIAEMKRSWSWRIGASTVRILSVPRDLLRRARARTR